MKRVAGRRATKKPRAVEAYSLSLSLSFSCLPARRPPLPARLEGATFVEGARRPVPAGKEVIKPLTGHNTTPSSQNVYTKGQGGGRAQTPSPGGPAERETRSATTSGWPKGRSRLAGKTPQPVLRKWSRGGCPIGPVTRATEDLFVPSNLAAFTSSCRSSSLLSLALRGRLLEPALQTLATTQFALSLRPC